MLLRSSPIASEDTECDSMTTGPALPDSSILDAWVHRLGSNFLTAGPGRATTCTAMSLPNPSTLDLPTAMAAVTAESSSCTTTVT